VSIPRAVTAVRALKVRPDRRLDLPEHLATEEPMQILLAGPGQEAEALAVTMRTPGHDFELAAGFVVTEGMAGRDEIVSVDYCEAVDRSDPATRYNHVTVRLDRRWEPPTQRRYFAAASSCGTCGKATIEQIETECRPLVPSSTFPAALIPHLPDRLRRTQRAFDRTGGLHAAGLFDADGNLCCAREDVGRHNAVDKVVGWTVLAGSAAAAAGPAPGQAGRAPSQAGPAPSQAGPAPSQAALAPSATALVVSGRVSFEIVQKAAMAGIGLIAAVSAPSSLAVEAGERLGVTIAAFVRGETFNVYTHPDRLHF
jgi:FdhD protein